MGEISVRIRTVLCLAGLSLICFTIAARSAPVPDRLAPGDLQPVPDKNQSLPGNISSVGDAEFSVDVHKNLDVNTVQFPVDDDTKVEGKLAAGPHATVEYGSNSDKHIAVRVVVVPASGMSLY
jgi:hypothetical protein